MEPAERNYFLLIVVVCVALGTCSVGTLAKKNCSFAALLSGVASLVGCWNSAAGSKISQSVETWQLADCSLFAALLGAKQSSRICNLAVFWQSELPSLCFCGQLCLRSFAVLQAHLQGLTATRRSLYCKARFLLARNFGRLSVSCSVCNLALQFGRLA